MIIGSIIYCLYKVEVVGSQTQIMKQWAVFKGLTKWRKGSTKAMDEIHVKSTITGEFQIIKDYFKISDTRYLKVQLKLFAVCMHKAII